MNWVFRGSDVVHVTLRTDPDRYHKAVSPAFKPNDLGKMTVWFVNERNVEPPAFADNYHKAVLGIPVVFEGRNCFGWQGNVGGRPLHRANLL